MQRITEWSLHPLGVEWSDYFQGFGTGPTEWEHAVNGIGCSEHEAGEDCLEQLAVSGLDIPTALAEELDTLSKVDEITAYMVEAGGDPESDGETPWVHFGIRYNTEEVA